MNEMTPILNDDCLTMSASQVYECVEVCLLQKRVLNYATLGFPFIRGSSQMNKMKPNLKRWLLAKCTSV